MGKKYSSEELREVLEKHRKWLNDEPDGCRADLRMADLREANLRKANLAGADLTGANLTGANLHRANLSWANLSWADFTGANLHRANLCEAKLTGAKLTGAELTGASLYRADLTRANLTRANLCEANLDYSVLPLCCGSLDANFDDRQLKQIAYHLVKAGLNSKNASKKTKKELAKLVDFANGFHRVNECGKIEY